MKPTRKYSFVIPTYKRPDVLRDCLQHINDLDYDCQLIEVIIVDNGESDHCREVGMQFADRLNLRYEVNQKNLGPGGSLNKGLSMATNDAIVISNDDAMVPPNFLRRCDELLASDKQIGCLGFRAIEDGYTRQGDGIGTIDHDGLVVGNFDQPTANPIEVDHVYGFCYLVTREALRRAGDFDRTLLAKIYASGNRIETDHCLEIQRSGLKVMYDGATGIPHLAKPRLDINERSLKWRLNDIRNTLYLFLKHFGLFGKGGLAIRYALLHDLGVLSMLKTPNLANVQYAAMGMRARASALWHWFGFLLSRKRSTSVQELSH